jgi:hypothetical protein
MVIYCFSFYWDNIIWAGNITNFEVYIAVGIADQSEFKSGQYADFKS